MSDYDAYECGRCHGSGRGNDPTLADKVCSSGNTVTRCPTCGGSGEMLRLKRFGAPSSFDWQYGRKLS